MQQISIIKNKFLISVGIVCIIIEPDVIFCFITPGHFCFFIFPVIFIDGFIIRKAEEIIAGRELREPVFCHVGPYTITKHFMVISSYLKFYYAAADELLGIHPAASK